MTTGPPLSRYRPSYPSCVCSLFTCRRNVAANVAAGGAERVAVAKVQVGLLGSARTLQRDLERIAKRADTNSSEGLAYVLQGALCTQLV